jgi:hypothetical protein
MPVRWMNRDEAWAFLAAGTEGRLATCDAAGQPYITPLNYLLHEEKLYFHCRLTGRKLENIAQNPRVCFEVSRSEKVKVCYEKACGCSTRYFSVLAFGTASVVADPARKTGLLNRLVTRYAEGFPFPAVQPRDAESCTVVEIAIEEISGKRNVDPGE